MGPIDNEGSDSGADTCCVPSNTCTHATESRKLRCRMNHLTMCISSCKAPAAHSFALEDALRSSR